MKDRIISLLNSAGRGSHLLLALLGVQLLLAGGLYWQSNRAAQFSTGEQLLALDQQAIDQIRIRDGEEEIKLTRAGEGWQFVTGINSDTPQPADTTRVNAALDSLSTLSAGLPVATTEAAQSQLEVADDNFQRHLTLLAGGESVAELYLGTSPGFRKSHARKSGELAIHAAKINVFDLPIAPDDWLDKSLLALSDVSEIAAADYKLVMDGENWTLSNPADIPEGKELASSRIDKLLADLSALRVLGIGELLEAVPADSSASSTEDGDDEADTLVSTKLTVTVDEAPVVLTLQRLGDRATIARDDIAGVFDISVSVYEQLADLSLDELLSDTVTTPPESGTQTDADSSNDQTEPTVPETIGSNE